ncbi:MAG: hypothetical protein ACRBF0_13155 [Calditrichia bacterium]
MQKTEKKLEVRLRLTMLVISARLAWGDVRSPLSLRSYFIKFFPPPRVMVYRKSPASYFSRN